MASCCHDTITINIRNYLCRCVYLARSLFDRLVQLIRTSQTKGSIFGLEYWKPDLAHHPVFMRLEEYFEKRFHYKKGTYNFLEDDFVRNLSGYEPLEMTDVKEQEKIFCDQTVLDDYAIGLPTSMSVFKV